MCVDPERDAIDIDKKIPKSTITQLRICQKIIELCIKCKVTPVSSTSALYSTEDDPLVDLKNFGLGRLLLILCNQVEFWMVNMTYNRVSNSLSDELLCGTKCLHEFNFADQLFVFTVFCGFN